jgi:hypothetical protein
MSSKQAESAAAVDTKTPAVGATSPVPSGTPETDAHAHALAGRWHAAITAYDQLLQALASSSSSAAAAASTASPDTASIDKPSAAVVARAHDLLLRVLLCRFADATHSLCFSMNAAHTLSARWSQWQALYCGPKSTWLHVWEPQALTKLVTLLSALVQTWATDNCGGFAVQCQALTLATPPALSEWVKAILDGVKRPQALIGQLPLCFLLLSID